MQSRKAFVLVSNRRRSRRGMALIYALFAAATAATMIAVTMTVALSSKRESQIRQFGGEARYLAEGAVEQAKRDVATAIANWRVVPATGSTVIDGQAVNYTATPTAFNTITTDAAGIQTIVTGFEIEARASVMNNSSTVHRLVNVEATPVFQFAVFYTNDLEINPGPNMTLAGRVHTNADMYLNCGGTLKVNTNYLRAVGSMYRNRKDDPSSSQGTVNIRNWVVNPFNVAEPTSYFRMNSQSQMSTLGIGSISGYDSRFDTPVDSNADGDFSDPTDWYAWGPGALAYWSQTSGYASGTGNTVQTGIHGLTQAAVPHIGSIKMYEPAAGGGFYFDSGVGAYLPAAVGAGTHNKGYFHEQADLTIITNAAGTAYSAYDRYGTSVALPGVVSFKSMYDARQAQGGAGNVKLTQIDLSVLSAIGKWPANGLIYAAQYGAGTGTNAKGVRLVNGGTLPAKLTVVSENSVYIKGDYNLSSKKGAAVIADAVNLLSKGWVDANKTSATVTAPTALATTYNVAMITGNTNTVAGGQYNGGLENLPRFHEKWTGVECKITGSFVNTWNSEFANAPWVIGTKYYHAPNRNWTYDLTFNTVANLPPFTPMAVTAIDVAAW